MNVFPNAVGPYENMVARESRLKEKRTPPPCVYFLPFKFYQCSCKRLKNIFICFCFAKYLFFYFFIFFISGCLNGIAPHLTELVPFLINSLAEKKVTRSSHFLCLDIIFPLHISITCCFRHLFGL